MDHIASVYWTSHSTHRELTLEVGTTALFGRGSDCAIRIGDLPEVDDSISRCAGALVVTPSRVFVESYTQKAVNQCLGVKLHDDPRYTTLGHGEGWIPPPGRASFDIEIPGTIRKYSLHVETQLPERASQSPRTGDRPTEPNVAHLTARQIEAVRFYLRLDEQGRARSLDPRGHADVAEMMDVTESTAQKHITDAEARIRHAGISLGEHNEIARRVQWAWHQKKNQGLIQGPRPAGDD